jgi:SnoaL-like domain
MRSDAFRSAAEAKDFSAVDELFSDDVVFRSPVVFKPYEGRDQLRMILSAVVEVFEGFRYVDQIEAGDSAALVFETEVEGRRLDGVDLLRFGDDGRIRELIVMVRPMSGVHALAEAMRRRLEAAGANV